MQTISTSRQITIGVGAPTRSTADICISMVLLQPHKARQTHSKKHLHLDEETFFISGQNLTGIKSSKAHIALAICRELSVPDRPDNAFKKGAEIYIASVAKFVNAVEQASKRL